MGVLRDRMQHDLVVRGPSAHTQRLYLFVMTDLTRYHRRPPDQLHDRGVQRYVRHLIEERRRAWGSLRAMVSGLRFFYWTTLGREPGRFSIPMPKGARKLGAIDSAVLRPLASHTPRGDLLPPLRLAFAPVWASRCEPTPLHTARRPSIQSP